MHSVAPALPRQQEQISVDAGAQQLALWVAAKRHELGGAGQARPGFLEQLLPRARAGSLAEYLLSEQ